MDNFKMDWQFGQALNGNIALTGEVDIARTANSSWPSHLARGITLL